MTQLAEKRISFIEQLHSAIMSRKGYGAYAYFSIAEVMELYDRFLNSGETSESFIDRFVRSV